MTASHSIKGYKLAAGRTGSSDQCGYYGEVLNRKTGIAPVLSYCALQRSRTGMLRLPAREVRGNV